MLFRSPRVTFSDADRRTRQTLLLNLYELEKTLGRARAAARTATDAANKGGVSETGNQLATLQADITTTLNTASGLSRAIEGYSGLPTTDQRRQLDWAFQDASKAIDALNRVLSTESQRTIVMPRRQ